MKRGTCVNTQVISLLSLFIISVTLTLNLPNLLLSCWFHRLARTWTDDWVDIANNLSHYLNLPKNSSFQFLLLFFVCELDNGTEIFPLSNIVDYNHCR